MAKKEYIVCPICFMNKPLIKTKDEEQVKLEFGRFDLNNNFFVQMRDIRGGRGTGGWFVNDSKSLTIAQAIKSPEYNDLLKQIYDFAKKFIKYVESLK